MEPQDKKEKWKKKRNTLTFLSSPRLAGRRGGKRIKRRKRKGKHFYPPLPYQLCRRRKKEKKERRSQR